ncbi:MAG: DUF1579 family protein [Actinobacteria bacterium]|nr:DUF1579 family protein [Actinomycetota bacterium]
MSAIANPPVTLELDASRQFDFWLGDWDCTWHSDGLEHVGTNSVYADLGGAVIVENFDGRPSLDFQGLSFSVYDRTARCWKQTWVDSEGSYLDVTGGYENGVMELRRAGEADGAPALFRMRFEHIEPNAFDWSWQRSADDGRTWMPLWEIEYRRVV